MIFKTSVADPERRKRRSDYNLFLRCEPAEQQQSSMGQEEQLLKSEGRQGDLLAKYIALCASVVLAVVTWIAVLSNDPPKTGWFTFHPTLQSLSLVLFTYGVLTLQPTAQPRTKAAGLARHQAAMFLVGLPSVILGTSAVAYSKWINNREHMTTWHGTFGYLALVWILAQVVLGGGSVWFNGAAFGGGFQAKSLWKYHRLSGYLLFLTLLFTAHLGGGWSYWGDVYVNPGLRIVAYTLAPALTALSVLVRLRPSKMKFFA